MLAENKNQKDLLKDAINTPSFYPTNQNMSLTSFTKTTKLISALYMVTDIMDRDEPLRHKLRTLGTNLISDIHTLSLRTPNEAQVTLSLIKEKIKEIMSFLDIASTIRIVSEMNCSILKKEFFVLEQSVGKMQLPRTDMQGVFLNDFLKDTIEIPKGQNINRIGVQKGSTLLKALSKIESSHFNKPKSNTAENFNALKKQRREHVIKIIKDMKDGASIKDIALGLKDIGEVWGEKTLQREMMSMTNDHVLKKTGEKRWSRYYIA